MLSYKKDLSEKEVVKKIKNGKIQYFSLIVEKYQTAIFRYVKKRKLKEADCQDITQNVFIKLYKRIPKLKEIESLRPYLFTIAKNEIADFYRKNKKFLPLTKEIKIFSPLPDFFPSEIKKLIGKLKPIYQKPFLLYLKGFSYKEISDKLKIPLNTTKTYLRRAKIILKKNYEGK